MQITGFTGWLVERDPGPKFIWRDGLPGSHGDIPRGTRPRKAAIRMESDSGLYGATEINRGDSVIDLVRRRYHEFIGENPLLTERNVSDEPGPGYHHDWTALNATALTKIEVTERLTPPANLVPWH